MPCVLLTFFKNLGCTSDENIVEVSYILSYMHTLQNGASAMCIS